MAYLERTAKQCIDCNGCFLNNITRNFRYRPVVQEYNGICLWIVLLINPEIIMNENSKKWYVLRAVGGKEKKVKEYIENEIANGDIKGFVDRVLIPTEKVYQIRNGKKISKERNFFPGYVLIEASLVGEVAHTLRNVPNVIGFLSDTKDGYPVTMRQNEVNRIFGRIDELAETGEEINNPFVIEETVKVIDGPFNGFNGTIMEINEEKKKLQVMVKIFGRKTPLELSFMQVEKE